MTSEKSVPSSSSSCSLPGCIAMAAAAMAPALAVVLNAPAAVPAAGEALPLAFLLAFGVCLLVGNTVISFARRFPHTSGSFYAYNTKGLGAAGGFFTGWLLCLGYAILAPGLFTAFGAFTAEYVKDALDMTVPWWWFSLAGLALVTSLSLRSLSASVRVDLVLVAIEVSVFLILAIVVLCGPAAGRASAGFSASSAPNGWSGIGVGVVLGILSFIGFDAAATLGEETRHPKRDVSLAVAAALILVGLFYLVTVAALTTNSDLLALNSKGDLINPNPFLALADRHTPWLKDAVALCSIACILSCFLAVHNATARILLAMGRDGVLPSALGRRHPRWNSPHVAVCVQGLFTLSVGLALGICLGPGPEGAYGFTGAIGAVAIVIVWMMSGISLIRYMWREQSPACPDPTISQPSGQNCKRSRRWMLHFILPALSVAALAYPLWATIVSQEANGQRYRSHWIPLVVLAWLVVGVSVYFCLRKIVRDQRSDSL